MTILVKVPESAVFNVTLALLLGGCAAPAPRHDSYDLIAAQIKADVARPAQPDAVAAALLPPLNIDLPKAREPLEERFSVNFSNEVPARQFFYALVKDTRFSMLLDPQVSGTISVNLKDVTLQEALDAVRELYGYDYKVVGTQIYIRPLTMQTRMYQVNYLTGNRKGNSNLSVSSTSISGAAGQGSSGVSTVSSSDFWVELKKSLEDIVGVAATAGGADRRSVVISAQSGVVVIRAMPEDLRNVDQFLKATQISVDRQVILEAKILEVQLNDSYQSGVNWAAFAGGKGNPLSVGFVAPATTLAPLLSGTASALANAGAASITATPGAALGAAAGVVGSVFGLAFQTSNFATLISFLESQGTVHVLSSPRIATMNNQKAVLKIGTDEYYVTGATAGSSTPLNGSVINNPPNVTMQPFFSGVVLDVTPQIDSRGNIILHVHPQVNQVSTVTKGVNLGSGGSISLPTASSSVSEMDSIVRGQDGHIVALGGLMRQSTTADSSQLPGAGDLPLLGALFKNTGQQTQKRELVVLIKPTVVTEDSGTDDLREVGRRIETLQPRRPSEPR